MLSAFVICFLIGVTRNTLACPEFRDSQDMEHCELKHGDALGKGEHANHSSTQDQNVQVSQPNSHSSEGAEQRFTLFQSKVHTSLPTPQKTLGKDVVPPKKDCRGRHTFDLNGEEMEVRRSILEIDIQVSKIEGFTVNFIKVPPWFLLKGSVQSGYFCDWVIICILSLGSRLCE